ncbi:MAG: glycosyltransferase family 4 protein [Chitinispirillaceae bacterium]|nr:glycosyltransferase family 4 protein [Chitinispirillaceae bacterium]
MRVLLVSSFLPFAQTRFGGAARIYHLGQELAKHHDVKVVAFDGCNEVESWNQISPFARFMLIPRTKSGLLGKVRHFLDMGNALRTHAKELQGFIGSKPFDLVILAYALAPNLLRLRQVLKSPRIIYIEGDLQIRQIDELRHEAKGLVLRSLKFIRYWQIHGYYHSFLKCIDTFFLSTQTEIREVHRRFDQVKTQQLPYGMDVSSTSFLSPPPVTPVFGFIGNYLHIPNSDALLWYLETVHPLLRAKYSEYRLVVAGMHVPDAVAKISQKDPSLMVLGAIDDLADFYRIISVFVNPIISGRGIRTKVIEAAAFGRPIVSTHLGAEGTEPLQVVLGDNPLEFADRCIELVQSLAGLHVTLRQNRQIVENHFSAKAVIRLLLGELIADRDFDLFYL